jgi:hypothetical protein
MSSSSDYRQVALEFVKALGAREYDKAYAMTSEEYQGRIATDRLKASFEDIVPTDWGAVGPIAVGETLEEWPGKKSSDLGWACVSIGGDVYSEAVIVVVALDNEEPRVREVEFGRP